MNKPKPTPKRPLGIVFLILFIDLMGFSIIFPLFPAMLEHYLAGGADATGLLGILVRTLEAWIDSVPGRQSSLFFVTVLFGGILGSLYSLLQFLSAPFWGRLSDHWGRRRVLLITLAGTTASYLLWIFAGDFWILLLSRVLAGLMAGNISVATATVGDITSKEERSKGMAIVGIAFGLGFLLGPALGGISSLVDLSSYWPAGAALGLNPFSAPAMVAFLLALINVLWAWKAFPETLTKENRLQRNEPRKSPLGALFTEPDWRIRLGSLVYLIFILAFSGMEFTLTFVATERFNYTPLNNGLMFLYIGFWLIFTQGVFVRRFAPKYGERKLTLAGCLSGLVAFACISLFPGIVSFYIGLFFLSVGVGLTSPSVSALVSLYAGPRGQGGSLGIFRSAGALGRAFGPILAALIYFLAGSRISYLAGALLMLIPFALALRLPQPDKTDDADPAENTR